MRTNERAALLRSWLWDNRVRAAEMSRSTGITPQQLSHFLSGRRSISLPNALRLSAYTGIPVENLVDRSKILVLRKNGAAA